ncbi:MAG: glutaminase [Candidatus Cyclonatronum sp.]|nr:glutaminase [Cyclonatronum sp.]MCH8487635.1 glutaminase [Cyclonatronum sp.]
MNYGEIISGIYEGLLRQPPQGEAAAYIPELAKVNPDCFGVHLSTTSGAEFAAGDSLTPFSVQSITKVLALTMAFDLEGTALWQRVGVEPSGTPFNSLVQLEYENGIPRNPLINSGAMVVCDVLMKHLPDPEGGFLKFVQALTGDAAIRYNPTVAASERSHGYRNAALINLMKSFGNILYEPERVLQFYFMQCALEMNCRQLSRTFLLYAGHGRAPADGRQVLSVSKTKRINAIMQTCGFYDESGDFTFKVGLPGKSGVGGGIAAVHPGLFSVAVWSPRLNKKGNSVRGIQFLEELTTRTGSSVF